MGTIAALVVSMVLAGGCEKKKAAAEKPKSSKDAPLFSLTNYDGKTVSLSDYKGKIVVLEWFNYECPFVRYHYEEAETMVNLAEKYRDNVVWLAINSTSHQDVAKNKEFAEKYGVSYPILDDKSGNVGRAYGAETTPHIFIIDSNGKIAYEGAIDNSPMGSEKKGVINYVDKALEELIAGKAVSTSKAKPYGCSVKY